jgi:hypothetical protein
MYTNATRSEQSYTNWIESYLIHKVTAINIVQADDLILLLYIQQFYTS